MKKLGEKLATIFSLRRLRVTLQTEMLECAHACLSMMTTYYGQNWTLERLRQRFTPSSRGTSVSHLARMAQALGLNARVFRAEPHHLPHMKLPCILHWDGVHFVVLESCKNGEYKIIDPAIGRMTVEASEFDRRFTGIVVEMEPAIDFDRGRPRTQTSALALFRGGLKEHAWIVVAIIALALMLEMLALIAPLFIQTATDSILPSRDTELLVVLAIAFVASSLLQTVVSLSRSTLLIRLGEVLTVGWNSAVCGRLLQLPYIFFMRRSIGDINSRFSSIEVVQRTLTHRFVEGVLDGATAIFILVIIVAYSPVLAGLTLSFFCGYGLFRLATLPRILRATERGIRLQSSQQGLLLEVLHGIHSIKANGYEANQLARFNRKTLDATRALMDVQRLSSVVDEVGQSILRLHWIAAVGVSAALVMRGQITAGMLVAYVTYAYQFSLRSTRLLDQVADWRLLFLHGARLADIVSVPAQQLTGTERVDPDRLDLSVSGLHFRYNADGPWILRDVSFDVGSGECIAIKGPSGGGKSTLAKLMVGLLEAEEGVITVGGKSITALRRDELCDQIACVLQDDQLFNGTIAGNIAFFEPGFSREGVIAAAKLAQIHAEIMAMPLRYETRIFDLGASLSGGQRQRLILARALYRNPRILILDEASSHLDLDNERLVNEAISSLEITRIVIAHRPETLAIADRILEIRDGRLTSDDVCIRDSLRPTERGVDI